MKNAAEKVAEEAVNHAITPERPRPLMRELPSANAFPIKELGKILGDAARAIHDKVQAPQAIAGQAVLGAATLAVQGHADVTLPTGQTKPVSDFFVTIAGTGERKTACDDYALRPIRTWEQTLREKYEEEFPAYLNDKAAWDKAREHALKNAKGDRRAAKAALDKLGSAPDRPLEPMLTCQEPTFAGLCLLYSQGYPSLGIFATEGGQFIGGHGMSEDNKILTATGLSMAWDGEPIRRVRKGDGVSILQGRRLAMHLMVQPDIASIMLADRLLESQGMLSRCLVSAPDSAAGTRFWRAQSPESNAALKRYDARLLDILELPLPLAVGKNNELEPRKLPLSCDAQKLWIAFANHVEKSIAPDGEFQPICGLANKLPEHAARLSGVLTLIEDIEAKEISALTLAAGIELAKHYASEALRLFGAGRVNSDLQLAVRLLDWLRTVWKEDKISLPDIYQRSPIGAIRDSQKAKALVTILEGHGWLVCIPGGAIVNGEKRREAWKIMKWSE